MKGARSWGHEALRVPGNADPGSAREQNMQPRCLSIQQILWYQPKRVVNIDQVARTILGDRKFLYSLAEKYQSPLPPP